MRFLPILLLCVALASADEAREAAQALAKRLSSKDDAETLAALREATSVHHDVLAAPLIRLLKDKSPEVRTAAIEVLGMRAIPAVRKRAAKALAARLKPLSDQEETKDELLAVVQALHDLAQPATIKALLDMKTTTEADVMRARTRAVANVPSKEAIERLLQYGYKDRRGNAVHRSAVEALRYATGENIRGNIENWRKWWKENEAGWDPGYAAEQRAKKRAETEEKEARKRERKNRKRQRESESE